MDATTVEDLKKTIDLILGAGSFDRDSVESWDNIMTDNQRSHMTRAVGADSYEALKADGALYPLAWVEYVRVLIGVHQAEAEFDAATTAGIDDPSKCDLDDLTRFGKALCDAHADQEWLFVPELIEGTREEHRAARWAREKARIDAGIREAFDHCFPDLKPSMHDQDGNPYYNHRDIAQALGMTEEEMRDHVEHILPEMEAKCGPVLRLPPSRGADEMGEPQFPDRPGSN